MRFLSTILALLLAATMSRAEFLNDVQREEILERLERIQSAAHDRVDERYRVAMRAYTEAMGSNEAALDLYLKCIQKVRFEDRYKDNRDFREWRDKNEEKYSSPGFKYALRQQLRWLVLTLKANSRDPDRDALADEASTIVNSIFADIDKLNEHQDILKASAIGSVFAQAYSVKVTKNEWPASPVSIAEIYDKAILPPLRSPTKLKALRAAWERRIKLEEIDATEWVNTRTDFRKNGRRDHDREREARETLRDERQVNEETFQNETYPTLVWNMEVDLFKAGDEAGAAMRMLSHISKYIGHSAATGWADQLKGLLNPQVEGAPATDPSAP